MRAGLGRQACGTGIGAYAPSAEEDSTDGEPPTRGTRRPVYLTGVLVLALLFVLQLALAKPGIAATGVSCVQTGMETVTTNREDYAPGALVHVTGTGYGPGCDVVVKITRPDGLVVVGDGSDTPGSDTVTTDAFGNLAYDYRLDSFPAVIGMYTIDVLGDLDTVLAHMTFTDANNDANIAPGWAPTNTVMTFSTLYRKTT